MAKFIGRMPGDPMARDATKLLDVRWITEIKSSLDFGSYQEVVGDCMGFVGSSKQGTS